MKRDNREMEALVKVQEFIQNKLYNPYNYEFCVWCTSGIEDGHPSFVINTDKWSMDFEPYHKRLCFNGDGIDSKEFDQIKEIRDNGEIILSIFNKEMGR